MRAFGLAGWTVSAAFFACGGSSGGGSPFINPPGPATFSVTVVVQGPGAVRGSAVGSDCRGLCTLRATTGTTILFDAIPDSNASFQGWSAAAPPSAQVPAATRRAAFPNAGRGAGPG